MDDEVFIRLTDEQRQERHASILHHLGEAERLEAKKKAEAKATQELIDHEWSECYRLRRVLLDDAEARRQGDLRFGDEVVPSTDEATQALAAVAVAAGEGEAAKPTDPHDFTPGLGSQEGQTTCETCGAFEHDPVHHGGDLLPHVYSPDEEAASVDGAIADGAPCTFQGCGRSANDSIHDVLGTSSTALTAPVTLTFTCPACAAKLCRVHPHAFNADPAHDGDRCTCGFAKRAKVHRVEAAPSELAGDEYDGRPSLADA